MIRRRLGLFALTFTTALACGAAARADCGDELQKMAQEREAALKAINGLVAAAKGKQLDPEVFCAKSQPLNVIETKMLAYMDKNKDWCQFPDEIIAQLKATHEKSIAFAGKACKVAAEMKKAKEQAAAGGGGAPQAQPLPAGPL